jgi:dGTPase
MASKAQRIIADLFAAFTSNPRLLPPQYQVPADGDQARRVADYIAGMTDRYAIKEHRRCLPLARADATESIAPSLLPALDNP